VVGPRLRTLVIGLALDPDRVVLASQLIDAVWDEDRRRGRPTRLAHRHLGQGRRRPAGDRPCGHRRLGARRPAGPPAWRADRRGGPGAGAAGHDLCARAAPRAACPTAPAGLAAVAAPHQRTPVRRPLPVAADMPWPQCPRRTPKARSASARSAG
jgi:hypothetical protein